MGAIGGLVGGLGAAAAELGAAGAAAASGRDLDAWLPPELPPAAAEFVVVDVAREFLYSATSADDAAVARAEAILLECAPPGLTLNPGNGRDRSRPSTNPSTSSLSATRDAVATIRLLPSFGVDLAPARLASTKEKDPMDIVRACLAADPRRAHRRVDDLDALGRLVGVDGGELIAARGRAALAAGTATPPPPPPKNSSRDASRPRGTSSPTSSPPPNSQTPRTSPRMVGT